MRSARRLLKALHSDLDSYISHARRLGVNAGSTVAVGTRYEYTVQASLARFGLALQRAGGRADNGIDLLGTWRLPSLPIQHPLRVIVQCKALQSNTGPVLIRELEGAVLAAPRGWQTPLDSKGVDRDDVPMGNVIALLAATRDATAGIRNAMARSRKPIAYVHISQTGKVQQMIWNSTASGIGLEGIQVTTRFSPAAGTSTALLRETVLTWQGNIWEPQAER